MNLAAGYSLRRGSSLDRALLVKFMRRTHAEISPNQPLTHLAATVEQHLSRDTPLWWVDVDSSSGERPADPVACLWLGNAIDQRSGERHAYVLLLFVDSQHRRRGLATVLLQQGHQWAQERGDRQIALQVLSSNEPALRLYQKLGYAPDSVLMTRPLVQPD
ncbi:MAG TPA: GNAT family N-acetyltransferase [Trichocoleus sp.]